MKISWILLLALVQVFSIELTECGWKYKLNTVAGQAAGRCGPQFNNTYCGRGFCSKYSWCGPGLPSSDNSGVTWEDGSTNNLFSNKNFPAECLDDFVTKAPRLFKDNLLAGCEQSLRDMDFYKKFASSITGADLKQATDLTGQALNICQGSDDQKKIMINLWANLKNEFSVIHEHPQVAPFTKSIAQKLQSYMGDFVTMLSEATRKQSEKCIKEFMFGLSKFGIMIARLGMGEHDDFSKSMMVFNKEIFPMLLKCYTPF